MLVHNVEGLDSKKLNIYRKKTKKTQILLYDTKRRADDFIGKIKYRRNGEYDDIPHFIITKLGQIYQLYDSDYSSKTFGDTKIDRKIIKVAIENLGWLQKNTITGFMNNWIGDIYRSEPHIRSWRNYFFWDKYNESQYQSLIDLCDFLFKKHSIPQNYMVSHAIHSKVSDFKGVVYKSNFSDIYTDINPAFDFTIFYKDENEKSNRI
jgi:N-acetyl-anhydromuramyl-L-alanine amidase AmpD